MSYITRLRTFNFRGRNVSADLAPIVFVCGPNQVGKTAFIEAMLLAALGTVPARDGRPALKTPRAIHQSCCALPVPTCWVEAVADGHQRITREFALSTDGSVRYSGPKGPWLIDPNYDPEQFRGLTKQQRLSYLMRRSGPSAAAPAVKSLDENVRAKLQGCDDGLKLLAGIVANVALDTMEPHEAMDELLNQAKATVTAARFRLDSATSSLRSAEVALATSFHDPDAQQKADAAAAAAANAKAEADVVKALITAKRADYLKLSQPVSASKAKTADAVRARQRLADTDAALASLPADRTPVDTAELERADQVAAVAEAMAAVNLQQCDKELALAEAGRCPTCGTPTAQGRLEESRDLHAHLVTMIKTLKDQRAAAARSLAATREDNKVIERAAATRRELERQRAAILTQIVDVDAPDLGKTIADMEAIKRQGEVLAEELKQKADRATVLLAEADIAKRAALVSAQAAGHRAVAAAASTALERATAESEGASRLLKAVKEANTDMAFIAAEMFASAVNGAVGNLCPERVKASLDGDLALESGRPLESCSDSEWMVIEAALSLALCGAGEFRPLVIGRFESFDPARQRAMILLAQDIVSRGLATQVFFVSVGAPQAFVPPGSTVINLT